MYCIVMCTTSSKDEAKKLASKLIANRLSACIHLQKIESLYMWQGKIENEDEYLMVIKSESRKYKEIESFILKHHSYDIPEIIKIPIEDGSKEYLKWISSNLIN